jgi:protein-disulfide isomerase
MVTDLLKNYQGKVRFAYRDYPLMAQHPAAEKAAEASRCAGEQKKYWEYYEALFADPPKLEPVSLLEKAKDLRLNEGAFKSCLESGRYGAAVSEDMASGTRAGVNSVPAFFVNGIFLEGVRSIANLQKTIDEELARTSAEKK